MAARAEQLVPHLQRLVSASDPTPDADLLERFIRDRDEAAFSAIVERHGPMVLLACRRLLGDADAAEDCLQATFLVLARRAASIRRRESLGAFLHGVACRVARRARASRSRRGAVEAQDNAPVPADPHPDPLSALTARELMIALDEEVRRLPEIYRLPVVLCCLEGLSLEEAARRLGWTPGSVKGRLERGRKRLHDRLARRGLTLGAALGAVEVSRGSVSAATVRTALASVAGRRVADVPAHIAALTEGVFPIPGILTRLTVAAVLLTVAMAAGVGLYLQATTARPPEGGQQGQRETSASAPDNPAREDQRPALVERTAPLPPGALARMGSVRFCPGSTIQSVAFSPNSTTLASGNQDGTVWLWEVAAGKDLLVLRPGQTPVESVAFSPDGKLLACRDQNRGISLRDVSTGQLVRCLGVATARFPASSNGSSSWAFRIAFSPDGKTLAAASGDLTGGDSDIYLQDVHAGKELRRFRGHQGAVRAFTFAPDGQTLASGGADGTVRLWDPENGQQLHLLRGAAAEVAALAYSPDGKMLASGGTERVIRLWSTDGKELRQLPVPDAVKSVVFVDDGTLAWGDDQGTIHLLDVKAGKEVRQLVRHRYGVSDLCRSPDGKTLASVGGGLDHAVHLWQLDTGNRLSPPSDALNGRVESVAFSPDGESLVSASGDATVRFWDPWTGKERRRLEGTFGGMTHAAAFAPDGKTVVVAADGGASLRFLDAVSGRELRRIKHEGSGWFTSVAFAPDGKTLLAGGNQFDGQWRGFFLWDATTGKEVRQFRGHTDNVKSVAFSPDGNTVASGGEDRTVRLWDTASGKELRRLEGHRYYVDTVAFSPGGTVLASADARSIRFWEPSTGKELRTLDIEYSLSCIAFAPDGKTLASGEYDPASNGWMVRLREVATGREICSWAGHRNTVSSLAFSPDGRTLASGGWDTLILVWDVTGRGRRPGDRN
jgi:RNA polymerase sigma factor (sigma-70 family)